MSDWYVRRVDEARARSENLGMEAWRAYLETGSMREAARRVGVHEITIRKRIAVLRDIHNVRTNAQLADVLARTFV
jgi:hypothetical protein